MTFTAIPTYTADGVTQYELDPLMVIAGHPIRYVIALTMSGFSRGGRKETLVYAADADGCGDAKFFMEHGYIAEHIGVADMPAAMQRLGYDVVPALRLVSQ